MGVKLRRPSRTLEGLLSLGRMAGQEARNVAGALGEIGLQSDDLGVGQGLGGADLGKLGHKGDLPRFLLAKLLRQLGRIAEAVADRLHDPPRLDGDE